MTLIEILTAISLFCPHESTAIKKPFLLDQYNSRQAISAECARKVWKCIDAISGPRLRYQQRHGDLENVVSGVEISAEYERCFR